MEWINFHHLLYFYVVAKEGGLVAAGKVLRLSHPTLSAQIQSLENQLGEKLFNRTGRKLVLSEMGQVVYRYADEIFSLGREMLDTVKGRSTGQPLRLNVGVTDVVPKLIVQKLLEPALTMEEPVRLVCYEESSERLLAQLALHSLDVVISDSPVPSGSPIRAYTHELGETSTSFFCTKGMKTRFARGFPKSLDGAPLLLPLANSVLRRSLNQWFEKHKIVPRVVAEFEDSALMKVFGSNGLGIFPAPTAVAPEVIRQYQVELLGHADTVVERFYAISAERKIRNPAVVVICDTAERALFYGKGKRKKQSPAS